MTVNLLLAALPFWLLTPINMFSASCMAQHSTPKEGKLNRSSPARGPKRPANEIFDPKNNNRNDFLKFFTSSKNRRRGFCGRCGTMLYYQPFPPSSQWPKEVLLMIDLVLGTVTCKYLESLTPDRHLWWDFGIDWVRKLAIEGLRNLPLHPSYKVGESID